VIGKTTASGSIVHVTHGDTDSQSLIVFATEHGWIHAWDLRAKTEAWKMKQEVKRKEEGRGRGGRGRGQDEGESE
jgi:hypothetical protein